jgi:VCBS repeat-containing protein
MSSSRGRNDVSLLNFALQDFGALSALRDGTALQAVMSSGIDRFEKFALAPHSISLAQSHGSSLAHGVAPLALTAHFYTTPQVTHFTAHHDNGYDTSPDHTTDQASHLVSAHADTSAFAPGLNLAAIAAPQFDTVQYHTPILHGSEHSAGAAGHVVAHNGAPPPAVAIGGQLWFGTNDFANTNLDHIDTDGAGQDVADHQTSGAAFDSVAIDGACGFYFGITSDGLLRSGHITNDQETGEASQISAIDVVFGTGGSADEIQALAIDPLNHILFVGLWGQHDATTGILEFTYNPTTGVVTSPYNASTGAVTDFSHMLFQDNNAGLVNGVTAMTNIIAMQYDMQNGNLYYVDQTNIWAGSTTSTTAWAQRNGIFVVSSAGNVQAGTSPTPTQLSLNSQFAAGDNSNYIEGLAINEAQGLIYFAVNNGPGSTSKLFYMPIAGGTATQMTLPGGVPAFFIDADHNGTNPLSFDANLRELFVSDNSHHTVCQLTLSADGHSFTSGNDTFLTIDNQGGTGPTAQYFDPLPTLSALSPTTTEAVQGGAAITLLTAAPTITDPQDGVSNKLHMGFMQIVIANAQAGDNLFYSGAQSGTFDSGKMTISWNSSTHTLTLTGNETEATYDTFFQNVTFQDSGTDNSTGSHPTRTVDWIISDGTTIVNQTTASVNERATTVVIDRAPTVVSDSYNVVETQTATGTSGTGGTGVLGNDSDKDADAIAVSQVNGSAANVGNSVAGTYGHLTLNSNGSFSYIADITSAIDAAATGSHPIDTFTYQVTDGLGGLSTTTVSFTIDRPPTVVADAPSGQALEGGAQINGNVLTNDSDKDGDSLIVSQVNGSAGNVGNSVAGTYGHMTINSNGTYSYTADNTAAINGAATGSHLTDTFTYQASDGHGGFTSTSITVTVDRPPTVVADNGGSEAVESGSAVVGNVLTNDSDRDADTLSVSAVNGVAGNVGASVAGTYGHVTISSSGGYSYTADNTVAINGAPTGSHLTDTFNYTASDGHGGTTSTTLTFTIDRPPTVVADNGGSDAVESGSAVVGNVLTNDSDRDGDTLSVSAVNGVAGNVGTSVAGTYGHITINSSGGYSYTADNTSAINGAATGSHLTDSFTYTASDGLGGTTTTTVTFTIDRPPTVVADNPSGEALESGSSIGGNVLTNDSDRDGDSLVVSAVNGLAGNVGTSVAGTYGHITIGSNGVYTYSADNTAAIDGAATGSHLTDSFTYTASDGLGGTAVTTITVTIDRAPTVVSDSGGSDAVESGSAVLGNVLTNDSDRDGDSLVVSAVNGVAGNVGAFVLTTYGHILLNADGSYSYTADNTSAIDGAATGSHLTDTVTYTASDGLGGTTSTTVTFTIDRAPTVVNDSNNTSEGGSLNVNTANGVLTNDSDRDGDSITISAVSGSAANVGTSTATTYGHITLNANGSYSYTADNTAAIDAAPSGSHPVDVISFTVSDGFGGFTVETLSITLDRPAVATADSLGTIESAQAISGVGGNPNLLANDVDKDGDAITITAVNGSAANVGVQIALASGALLTVNADGTYTYDPNHAFDYLPDPTSGASNATATDTFTYTVDGGSSVTVTVTVTGQDSNDTLIGTTGNDTLHGGVGNDVIFDDDGLMHGLNPLDTSAGHSGGTDSFSGDAGDDLIYMGGNLTAADQIDGGTGNDVVYLNGDYSGGVVFGATTMVNVEHLALAAGHVYNLTTDNATVAAGQTLTVHAGALGAGDTLTFDASADTTGGKYVINAGAGNDVLTGGSNDDIFRAGAGNDTIQGGGGNDRVDFVGNFTAADSFNGGSGDDTVRLQGDYSAGVTLGANTFVSVESLELVAGHSYKLTMNAATVAAGATLTVHAGALVGANILTFDGSADTAGGNFTIYSGAGNDVLTGGSGNDSFHPGVGNDTIHGGGGDDIIDMQGFLTAADSIDGGSGNDTVYLSGNYSGGVTFTATTMTNVERITLTAGHSYNLTINNATVAAGQTMTLAGNNLGAADSFIFDGSHDTSGGSLAITGGAGNDTLVGGWTNDLIEAGNGTNSITGGGGSDTLYGGTGADTFIYNSVSDSTSTGYDKVKNFDANSDTFQITGVTVNAVDAAVNGGHLSGTHFDADLAAAIGAAQLAAHDAVLFNPDAGNLSGHTFLVVDMNGVAGYQAGQDLVIDLTGGTHLNNLSAGPGGNFG